MNTTQNQESEKNFEERRYNILVSIASWGPFTYMV